MSAPRLATPVEGRSPYDLVTGPADYPAREGPPVRTVLICSHPRSGSTLLGEAIYWAGGLGCPLEYLHRGFRPALAARWNASALPDYVRALYRFRTDPSGVLSSKLFWRDLDETALELGEGTTASQALDAIFPQPTFVYLRRRDRVRQAVSAFAARSTGTFRALDEASCGGGREVAYDYEGILRELAAADASHACWRQFFTERRIVPLRVDYEDLVNDYSGTVERVVSCLSNSGEQRPPVRLPQPRLRRQADATSEGLIGRFLRDHAMAASRTAGA